MLILLMAMLPIGCGLKEVPVSDVSQAEVLMREVLVEWKSGNHVEALREQSPPIFVSDESWNGEQQLEEFELLGDGRRVGTNVQFRVRMKCVGAHGRKSERIVEYIVTTQPARTIARVD